MKNLICKYVLTYLLTFIKSLWLIYIWNVHSNASSTTWWEIMIEKFNEPHRYLLFIILSGFLMDSIFQLTPFFVLILRIDAHGYDVWFLGWQQFVNKTNFKTQERFKPLKSVSVNAGVWQTISQKVAQTSWNVVNISNKSELTISIIASIDQKILKNPTIFLSQLGLSKVCTYLSHFFESIFLSFELEFNTYKLTNRDIQVTSGIFLLYLLLQIQVPMYRHLWLSLFLL